MGEISQQFDAAQAAVFGPFTEIHRRAALDPARGLTELRLGMIPITYEGEVVRWAAAELIRTVGAVREGQHGEHVSVAEYVARPNGDPPLWRVRQVGLRVGSATLQQAQIQLAENPARSEHPKPTGTWTLDEGRFSDSALVKEATLEQMSEMLQALARTRIDPAVSQRAHLHLQQLMRRARGDTGLDWELPALNEHVQMVLMTTPEHGIK